MTVNFQSQERPQSKADVIALRSTAARLASLYATKLLDASMKVLNRPGLLCILHSGQFAHLQIIGCPVFNAPICGDCLEYFDQPILFEVHDLTTLSYFYLANGPIARAVRVNLSVLFQASQPDPSERADHLEVINAAIPAIKDHTLGLESSLTRYSKHLLKVIILRKPITLFVVDAIITRDVTVAVAPQQSDEIDAADHILMLARPMTTDQFNLASIRLVQSRIVKDKDARVKRNLLDGFAPQIFAAWLKAFQQASERIVRSSVIFWLDSCCFCAAINFRSRNQKINVVVLVTLWSIHSGVLHYFIPTA
jgi:hypothetical protein